MYKETITYNDFNGVEKTRDYFFHLSKTELMEWEASIAGGMSTMLRGIVDAVDGPSIMENFKKLILKSYGIKHADGERFEKSDAISEAFSQSPAYDILFEKIVTNAEFAAKFVGAILPDDGKNSAQTPNLHPVNN